MAQVKIEITRGDNDLVTFNPQNQSVTTLDNVFWVNYDAEAHWPAPKGGKTNDWLSSQIPGKQPGAPPASSGGVTFFDPDSITKKNTPYTTAYYCVNHPNRANETGTITVTE